LQIRDSTGARIMFPTDKDDDKEVITIVGKKESVEKAKAELEATIKEIVSKTLFYFLLLLMVFVSYESFESHNFLF
jgi:KH domain